MPSQHHHNAHEGRRHHRWPILSERVGPLDGPTKLATFYSLPQVMRDGAWLALRLEVERARELHEASR
jgi:hypothetical protein